MNKLNDTQFKKAMKAVRSKYTKLKNKQEAELRVVVEEWGDILRRHKHHGGVASYSWSGKKIGKVCSVCHEHYKP